MIMEKKLHLLGPTAWGEDDRTKFYNDLVWTGQADEKFLNKGKKHNHPECFFLSEAIGQDRGS